MRRRNQKRCPGINQVVKLCQARCDAIEGDHELYVSASLEPVMPCLAVNTNGGSVPTWTAMVVAVPENAPYQSVQAPEIAGGLEIIAEAQKAHILYVGDHYCNWLFKRSFYEAPFLREDGHDRDDARWSPVVLADKVDLARRHENWELLRNWQSWIEEARAALGDTADNRKKAKGPGILDYLHWRYENADLRETGQGALVLSTPWVPTKYSTREMDAFRKRLSYAGLTSSRSRLSDSDLGG